MLLIRALPLDSGGKKCKCAHWVSYSVSVQPDIRSTLRVVNRSDWESCTLIALRWRRSRRISHKQMWEILLDRLRSCGCARTGNRLHRIKRNLGSDRLEYISSAQTPHDLLLQHQGFSVDQADLKDSLQSWISKYLPLFLVRTSPQPPTYISFATIFPNLRPSPSFSRCTILLPPVGPPALAASRLGEGRWRAPW